MLQFLKEKFPKPDSGDIAMMLLVAIAAWFVVLLFIFIQK